MRCGQKFGSSAKRRTHFICTGPILKSLRALRTAPLNPFRTFPITAQSERVPNILDFRRRMAAVGDIQELSPSGGDILQTKDLSVRGGGL